MSIARKVSITVAAVALALVGMTAPAEAKDTSWGCGGAYFAGPGE